MEESSASRGKITENRDTRPVPDPTVLTTQAISREIGALSDLLESKLKAITDVFDARLDGMDKAITLLQHQADKSISVGELNARHGEKFESIRQQFEAIADLAEKLSIANKDAITVAMSAQEKAAGKQQDSNNESIKKSETLMTKQVDGLESKINDLKERFNVTDGRVTTIEGRTAGMTQSHRQTGENLGIVIGAAGLIAAVVMAVVAVLSRRP